VYSADVTSNRPPRRVLLSFPNTAETSGAPETMECF
jgi:hypothetical protein